MKKRSIRFDDEVPIDECHSCQFACCAHPMQRVFTQYEDAWLTYRKLCIKDLSSHLREKVLNSPSNRVD